MARVVLLISWTEQGPASMPIRRSGRTTATAAFARVGASSRTSAGRLAPIVSRRRRRRPPRTCGPHIARGGALDDLCRDLYDG
jgi:hypothetical protein